MKNYDVVIVGAGPAGLAAARGALDNGAEHVLIIERDYETGGILNQCIHDGFGLIRYGEALSGPEYAGRVAAQAEGAELMVRCQVTSVTPDLVVTAVSPSGLLKVKAGAVVLATGCRERTRGAISIPGSRPAGVYTAGVAQNLVNVRNILPGTEAVILGSGDIGLIMARRLTLEGVKVNAVVEILPEPAGLSRNVSQCLYDFDIPLYVRHTVTEIYGKKRVEGVQISAVDEDRKPIPGTQKDLSCDTLILSVGLIPENEVALTAGVELRDNNSVVTDKNLQTSVPGIFSCGNSRRVMDLADFASEQGELAGRNAAAYACGGAMADWDSEKAGKMAKGFPKKDSVTCTLCPNGCQVVLDEATGTFSGNRCPRGEAFARQELSVPHRTVTTSVRVFGGIRPLMGVRSRRPVERSRMSEIIRALDGIHLQAPVKAGEVIWRSDDGVEIITAESMDKR